MKEQVSGKKNIILSMEQKIIKNSVNVYYNCNSNATWVKYNWFVEKEHLSF